MQDAFFYAIISYQYKKNTENHRNEVFFMAGFKFKNFGVMIDCSRNAVMSLDGLKRYFTLLKKMGYNTAEEFNKKLEEEFASKMQ